MNYDYSSPKNVFGGFGLPWVIYSPNSSVRFNDDPLNIESFEKCSSATHFGTRFQKRGISSIIAGNLCPQDHVDAAKSLTFPLAEPARLPKDVKDAAFFIAKSDPVFIRLHWKKTLGDIKTRASALEPSRRADLDAFCRPELRHLSSKIHIPLLKELMSACNMGGSDWVDQFYLGFPLIGTQGEPGVYPQQHDGSDKMLSREEVLETSFERFHQRASASASPFDIPLWEEALLQRDRGWLLGPHPIIDGKAIIDGSPTILNFSFRFGVQQGEKLRAVDDLRQSRTNDATFINTPINLPTWDHFTALTTLLRALHPTAPLAMGKADHEDAYKQLPLLPSDRKMAAVTLKCPLDGNYYCFLTCTQLFGSVSAVLQYNCLSRIIATLAVRLLKIPVMGYYDDFGLITPESLTGEALEYFCELNRLLGFSMKRKKTLWGAILEFLGIVADFTPTPEGPPILRLSEERKEKLSNLLKEMLSEKTTSRARLQKLLGKLNFAHTAVLGKYAGATLRPLYALLSAKHEASRIFICKDAELALKWWIRAIWTLAPRLMIQPRPEVDFIIYSDAEGLGGCAALLYKKGVALPSLLKRKVDARQVEAISTATSAIYILEMYAMVAAVSTIRSNVPINILLFMDNDAAAQAIIKGSAPTEFALLLIKLFWNHVASNHINMWLERVASACNPADAPSRGRCLTPKPRETLLLPSFPLTINKARNFLFPQKE